MRRVGTHSWALVGVMMMGCGGTITSVDSKGEAVADAGGKPEADSASLQPVDAWPRVSDALPDAVDAVAMSMCEGIPERAPAARFDGRLCDPSGTGCAPNIDEFIPGSTYATQLSLVVQDDGTPMLAARDGYGVTRTFARTGSGMWTKTEVAKDSHAPTLHLAAGALSLSLSDYVGGKNRLANHSWNGTQWQPGSTLDHGVKLGASAVHGLELLIPARVSDPAAETDDYAIMHLSNGNWTRERGSFGAQDDVVYSAALYVDSLGRAHKAAWQENGRDAEELRVGIPGCQDFSLSSAGADNMRASFPVYLAVTGASQADTVSHVLTSRYQGASARGYETLLFGLGAWGAKLVEFVLAQDSLPDVTQTCGEPSPHFERVCEVTERSGAPLGLVAGKTDVLALVSLTATNVSYRPQCMPCDPVGDAGGCPTNPCTWTVNQRTATGTTELVRVENGVKTSTTVASFPAGTASTWVTSAGDIHIVLSESADLSSKSSTRYLRIRGPRTH